MKRHSNQNKTKKAELRKLVLLQLQKLRERLMRDNPQMLEDARALIEAQNEKLQVANQGMQTPELAIDQNKNRRTIETMLALKSDNPAFEKAVKAMLSKQN